MKQQVNREKQIRRKEKKGVNPSHFYVHFDRKSIPE